jgi:exosome complex component RRP41
MGSSIRRTDLLALSNLRNDGRKPHEIRRMRVQLGPISTTTSGEAVGGSALVEMGLTVALATVRGPLACLRRSDELPDKAVVDVSVRVAPFASSGGDRRISNPNTDRKLVETSKLLQKALEATILLQLYPKSRLRVEVAILADDGGRLCAAINAASAALIDAGIPTKDVLVACSAGYSSSAGSSDGTMTLVDLNRAEESAQHGKHPICLPCAMLPQRGTLVLSQCEARLPDFETLDAVLESSMAGCRAVFGVLQAALLERAEALMGLRRGTGTVVDSFAQKACSDAMALEASDI